MFSSQLQRTHKKAAESPLPPCLTFGGFVLASWNSFLLTAMCSITFTQTMHSAPWLPLFIPSAQMTSLTTFPVCTGVFGIKVEAIGRFAPLLVHFSCINKCLYIYIYRGTWDWSAIELHTVRLVCSSSSLPQRPSRFYRMYVSPTLRSTRLHCMG